MKLWMAASLWLVAMSPATAAPPSQSVAAAQVTVEYYYRIRWGSGAEFKRLYERNHAPILREMQRQGFITNIRVEEPLTHMGGGARWDLRVTITFRDAAAAVLAGGEFDRASEAASLRLYPDRKTFEAEEERRFSLLEEHWDVIVIGAADD
jgi:hypothetical protein